MVTQARDLDIGGSREYGEGEEWWVVGSVEGLRKQEVLTDWPGAC